MNNSGLSKPLPPTSKRRHSLGPESSTAKRGRISESTISKLADAGKQVIGKPLLFKDGLAINWGKSPMARPISETTQSSLKPENDVSKFGDMENGHSSSSPIVIDEYCPLTSQETPNATKARLATPREVPSLYRKVETADEKTVDIDIIEIDLTDSNNFDSEGTLVSQAMDQEFPEGLNAARRTNLVLINNLPSYILSRDIARLLDGSGFSSSVVDEIVRFRHGTVSLKFTHSHIADAVYSVIRHKALPFPWRSRLGPLEVVRWVRDEVDQPSTRVNSELQDNTDLLDSMVEPGILDDSPSVAENSHTSFEALIDDEAIPENHATESKSLLFTSLVESTPESLVIDRDSSSGESSIEEGLDSGTRTSSESDVDDSSKYPLTSRIIPRERAIREIRRSPDPSDLDVWPNRRTLPQAQASTSRAPIHSVASSATKEPAISRESSDEPNHAIRAPRQPGHRTLAAAPARVERMGLNPCRLPATPYNRPRRVLFPPSSNLPIVTVSMRADAQFINRETKQRISSYSLPSQIGDARRVNDACSIGNTIVIAYELGPCQISLIPLIKDEIPRMKDIDHKAHTKTQTSVSGSKQDTPWVSCLAPARLTTSTISFITGGHDKSVKLWKVDSDGHASSERIGGIGVSAPSALVSRDGTVLVSAGKHLFTLDMHHKAAALAQAKLSNPINQIHIHPNAPTITILEVDHLDTQIQVFDSRRAGFNRPADCSFGYRSEGGISSRYNRGSTYLSYFVRGYEDGCVCIWDYRNTKQPVVEVKKGHTAVFHTVITASEIICYGGDGLTFRNHGGELL